MTTDPESFLVAFAWPHANARRLESCDTLTGPFLRQRSRNLRELLGHDVWIAGPLEFRQVNEPDGESISTSPATPRGSVAGNRVD